MAGRLALGRMAGRLALGLVAWVLVSAQAEPQGIQFEDKKPEDDISNRHHGSQGSQGNQYPGQGSQYPSQGNQYPNQGSQYPGQGGHLSQHTTGHTSQGNVGEQCCCLPQSNSCLDQLTEGGEDDLVGLGLINERIVNKPGGGQQVLTCGYQQRLCCYPESPDYDFSVFQRGNCRPPTSSGGGSSSPSGRWTQGCNESPISSSAQRHQQCGTRPGYSRPVSGLSVGESSPGEFPWTCLLLNQDNDFLGTCAVVPENFGNDLRRGTRKILTAAHNLKKIGSRDRVKVRVGEYDASGQNFPETKAHIEYSVDPRDIVRHPQFDPKRLSNDIAVLKTRSAIDLRHQYVNPACFPSCDDQFDHVFHNGTGVRCWTAGWGKNEFSGSFQFIQHKVDVPLVPDYKCEAALKQALNTKKPGVGTRFKLHVSEVCAGTENGKDACTGDGGSPLVCQAKSGRWTVVGLVSWGIGCATHLPGVYTNVYHFRDWINRV